MTATPDPAEITPPTDPARYARRRSFGLAFWAVLALIVVVFAAGVMGARLWPRLWVQPVAAPQAPAASAPAAEPIRPVAPVFAPQAAAVPEGPSPEIAELRRRIDALEVSQARTVNAAAAALAAASLAEATQRSGPFEAELAALERLLPMSAEIQALQPYAETGAPSRAALAADFDAAAGKAAVAAQDPGEGAGFLARLRHALSSIVTIRRVDTTTGGGADAILVRADQAVAEGDVEGALRILRDLPPKAAEAMAPWRARAQQRVAVDRQVAAVRALALSQLMAVQRVQP
jgi:hypothetical protein